MQKTNYILFILAFCFSHFALAQQDTLLKLIKVGVKGYGGIVVTNELHDLSDQWVEQTSDVEDVETTKGLTLLLNKVEYGYQPFLLIHPIRLLQVGVKMDCSSQNVKRKSENPITKVSYDLKMQTKSYIPGAFAYLTLNKFEIGGGILYSYTSVKVNDDFLGYFDTWSGKNVGFEVSIGHSSGAKHLVGFTSGLRYRFLKIGKLTDSFDRSISHSDTNEGLSLDLSGLMIDMGLYFQFINIKKHSK